MPGESKHHVVVLNIRKLGRLGNFILKMQHISLCMSEHPELYPSPFPSLATFNSNIEALIEANTQAQRRTTGYVALRNVAYTVVFNNVSCLKSYVQTLADCVADPNDAINLIAFSGFDMKQYGTRTKSELEARNTKVSGVVKLYAKSPGKNTSNEWKMSFDNITWTQLPSTMQAKTIVHDLIPRSLVYFQHRPIFAKKTGSWSHIVSINVT